MTKTGFAAAFKSSSPPSPSDPHSPVTPPPQRKTKRRHIGGYFDPEIAKRLRMLASEEETTVQELLTEALRLLFEKRGLSVL